MSTFRSRPTVRIAALPLRDRAVIFALVVAWAVFAGLYPWFPGVQRFDVGTVPSVEVHAPRDVTYVSEILTRQQRDRAASAVADVRVFDPSVRARRLADLDRRLERIDVVRRDVTLSAAARDSGIRAFGEDVLSERSASALGTASEVQWKLVGDQARALLGRVLALPLSNAADVEAQRSQLGSMLQPELGPDLTEATVELVAPFVVETLSVDRERTAAQRAEAVAAVEPVSVSVAANDVVVKPGTALSDLDVERLDWLGLRSRALSPSAVLATGAMSALIGGMWGGFLFVVRPLGLRRLLHLALAAVLLGVPFAAFRVALPFVLPDEPSHYLWSALPFAAAAMTAAVLLDTLSALMVAVTIAVGIGFVSTNIPAENGTLLVQDAVRLVLYTAATSIGGVFVVAQTDRVQRFIGAGMVSAGAGVSVLLSFWLLNPARGLMELPWLLGTAGIGGLAAAGVTLIAMVSLSRPFGVITRIRLLELAQLSHPLLRRLQDEAPGTFQHSVLVGNLAERAADRIGANAQLARVGAYYHDVGKLVAPTFFVENVHPNENPHEGLDPVQSTRVIHQHVTAGMELARRAGVPPAVTQFIPEHHGTRLMTFFYRRAAEDDPDVDVELFRYPGPRPSSRESALVMIADACEATVRASLDRSEERIRGIVDGVIRERIEEHQFDECDITLRDLATAADSFTRALAAVYHPRVPYPAPTTRELDARRVEALPPPPSARAEGPRPLGLASSDDAEALG